MEPIKPYLILLCDDDENLTKVLQDELAEAGYHSHIVYDGDEAIEKFKVRVYDLVLLDLDLPKVNGIEVLKFIASNSPLTQVIMLTGSSDINTAVQCMKLGAYDFITKPYEFQQLLTVMEKGLEKKSLLTNNTAMKKEISQLHEFEIIGQSIAIKYLLEVAAKAANSDLPLLIEGDTGTGKELLARYIHQRSPRKSKPIVSLNCAALSDTLFESELFGHEKGSFTDAKFTKQGLVEIANFGTLFLDEIGELSPQIQPKLLRFLETGEYRRVGGLHNKIADVRLIAATNKDLMKEANEKRFRQDLLFRLNVITLRVPPLSERTDDIILLAKYFLKKKAKSRVPKVLSPEAEEFLKSYNFPGNIRELEHLIERALIFCDSDLIFPHHFNLNFKTDTALKLTSDILTTLSKPLADCSSEELERIHIKEVLEKYNWNRDLTAKALGISKKTLYTKIKTYNIH